MTAKYRPAYTNRFGTVTAVLHRFDADNDWFRDYDRIYAESETWAALASRRRCYTRWELLEFDELMVIPPKPPIGEHAEGYELLPDVGFPLDNHRVRRIIAEKAKIPILEVDEPDADVLPKVKAKKRAKPKRYSPRSRVRVIRLEDHNNHQLISDAVDRWVYFVGDHWLSETSSMSMWDHKGNWVTVRMSRAVWLMEFGYPLDSNDLIQRRCGHKDCINPIHHTLRELHP